MKKILIIVAIAIIAIISREEKGIIIPESSIRFRVIANSNSLVDQANKNKVSKVLSNYIYELIKNARTKDEATNILNQNYQNINGFVNDYLVANNIENKYELSIGRNFFERKEYNGIKYNQGYYDSIVLSLGNKSGVNFWCVMYPPLCLINSTDKVEYTTLVKDMLDKYSS